MSDASTDMVVDDGSSLVEEVSTTLVEVTPGVAVVLGDVPDGVDLFELDQLPSFDKEQLAEALGTIGNVGTMVGNAAEAISSVQGLYRVNDATLALLKSGGELAAKDGAKIGAILKNGKIAGQARFIPASVTAATMAAAIGPAVAMLALQMQLGEISSLVRTNIALTTKTLKAIRNEQWSDLEALVETVSDALEDVREAGSVPDSTWESIAPNASPLRSQMKLYRNNVMDHVRTLEKHSSDSHREYLEQNAEAIIFDSYALLSSLKAYGEYQGIRAALARKRSDSDPAERQIYDRICRTVPDEIQNIREEMSRLIDELVRQLRIIAELPGRANLPLTKKRKDTKSAQLTCTRLLELLEPLVKEMCSEIALPAVPNVSCVPEGLDLQPYLNILRWYMEADEKLLAVAFPFEADVLSSSKPMRSLLEQRIEASWAVFSPNRFKAFMQKLASSAFVAVTDRRVVVADSRTFLRQGELDNRFSLLDVRHVRSRDKQEGTVRPTVSVTTDRTDIHWMFPAAADEAQIDALGELLKDAVRAANEPVAELESLIGKE